MRLLTTSTEPYQLIQFAPNNIPPYAILSHTWGDGEILLADIEDETAKNKEAYGKIWFSCQQAQIDHLDYVWIDTCCIDKGSSAELSEAINSMYVWYQKAEVCYVYLSDIFTAQDGNHTDISNSRWFTRGWTLQELLAPSNVIFYTADGDRLGEKRSMAHTLSEITGIDEGVLDGSRLLESASIAQRMSWASKRVTTRLEDVAYSLMGIFSVNMPMLYGEGEKAFLRLQEEIMKYSDDQSLFVWLDTTLPEDKLHGLLAPSPAKFRHSNTVIPYQDRETRPPFSMTNRGLCIDIHLTPLEDDIYIGAIDFPVPPEYDDSSFLSIYLKKLPFGEGQYARIRVGQFARVQERGGIETIYVRQNPITFEADSVYSDHVLQLRKGPYSKDYRVINYLAPGSTETAPPPLLSHRSQRDWLPDSSPYTFPMTEENNCLISAILLQRDDKVSVLVLLGSSSDFKIGFCAIDLSDKHDINMSDIQNLQPLFRPEPANYTICLQNHLVRVSTETRIHAAIKYYLVDLKIQDVPGPYIPILDLVIGIFPGHVRARMRRKKDKLVRKFRRMSGDRKSN